MALKILIADDSMTAQHMGKKILVDAGYEIVLVSNGAAAIKKIAEQKPDIVILDIYMPGYNGLEVCERVKNARETAKLPVLLTVGKMEPYRAEDGAKVRADGIIIKPFEASDLLAAVAKLAELVAVSKPASRFDSEPASTPEFSKDMDYDWKTNTVQVPESISSAPAMMDELFTVSDSHATTATAFASAFEHGRPASFSVEPGPEFDSFASSKFGQSDIYPFESLPDPSDSSAWETETLHATEQHVAEAVASSSSEALASLDLGSAESVTCCELEMPAPVVASESAWVAPVAEVELASTPTVCDADVAPPSMQELTLSSEDNTLEERSIGNDLGDFPIASSPDLEAANPEDSLVADAPSDLSAGLDTSLLNLGSFDLPAANAPNPNPLDAAAYTSESFPAIESYDSMMELFGIPEESAIQGVADVLGGVEPEVAEMLDAQSAHVEWAAEETAVLPDEMAALLAEEMEPSMTPTAPAEPSALPDEPIVNEAPAEQEVTASEVAEHAVAASRIETYDPVPVEGTELPEESVATETPVEQKIANIAEPIAEVEIPELEDPEAVTTPADEPGNVFETGEVSVEEAAALGSNFDVLEAFPSEDAEIVAVPLERPVEAAIDETELQPVVSAASEPSLEADSEPVPWQAILDQDSIDEILHPREPHTQEPEAPECQIEESHVEEFVPVAAAASVEEPSASTPALDASRIASVVQSVFERHKEQIIAEIIRELSQAGT